MIRHCYFIAGILTGLLMALLLLALVVFSLPYLTVVNQNPIPADAIVVLGGDEGGRLSKGLQLHKLKFAPDLILVAPRKYQWIPQFSKIAPGREMESFGAIFVENSVNTITDAQLALACCKSNRFRKILVVTSPYHTRRALLVFDDIFEDSGVEFSIISSDDYEQLVSPTGHWWADRRTLETIWLEVGKCLYWELTPFLEFKGKGDRLKVHEMER